MQFALKVHFDGPARRISQSDQLDGSAGQISQTDQLDGPVLYVRSFGQFAYSKIDLSVSTLSKLLSLTKALCNLTLLPCLVTNTSNSVMVRTRNILDWSELSLGTVFNTKDYRNMENIVVRILFSLKFSGFTYNIIGGSNIGFQVRPTEFAVYCLFYKQIN